MSMVACLLWVTMMNIAILLLIIVLLILSRVIIIQLNVLQSDVSDLRAHIIRLEYVPMKKQELDSSTKYRTNAGDTSKHYELYKDSGEP